MKKKISLVLLFLSILLFSTLYVYSETNLINQGSYDYHIDDFFGYIFLWSFVLFVLSLLAFKLDVTKYKIWLLISIIISLVSVLLAYEAGDGNGAIVDIDGELITWFFTGLYSFISIIYFIIQFKNRKNKNREKPEKNYFMSN